MSECPNCASAAKSKPANNCVVYECGSSSLSRVGSNPACELVRSLREELAEARDKAHKTHVQYVKTLLVNDRIEKQLAEAESSNAQSELDLLQVIIDRDKAKATLKEHELVCYGAMQRGRDMERDRIADWLWDTDTATASQASERIRNNEHRSDT
jgi:hypothetical protein